MSIISKNDAWKHIFKKLSLMKKINDDGFCKLTSNEIKMCNPKNKNKKQNQFEPRLLCSQNTNNERPDFFKEHCIYIFPIKNGTYYLCKYNIFFPLEYKSKKIKYLENDNVSLLLKLGDSETTIINKLYFSKIFESNKYAGEKITYQNPFIGRHRSCEFKMNLYEHKINVDGVQYEIDATFESKNKIFLIECKNTNKKIEEFNIKQLYYPYRNIYELTNNKKEIICLYIHQIKDTIHIWNFIFEDHKNMLSIKCTNYNIYKFYDSN